MLQLASLAALGCALPAKSHPDTRAESRELVAPRTVIFREGFDAAPQLRLTNGCVALSRSLPDGRRQIIDIVGPGRLIGLVFGEHNRTTAETLTYCQIEPARELGLAEFRRAVNEMVLRVEAHAILLGRKTAPERVASAILDLAGQFARPRAKRKGSMTFNLYLTRGEMADWLGLTVETVSRCFQRFRRAGLVGFTDPQIVTLLQPTVLQAIAAGRRPFDNSNNP
ncbi:MAG: Crp/Fnr family transcriptional regulator [Shinella sp.]|nr:MAG: Crp/Fnr family transcriptional regulator [Shinella sp.]